SQLSPDAVFIMMNPGSSIPLVPVNNRIDTKAIRSLPISLVPTRPDTTQYQVMRLMQHQRWQHVRVLNLSDLRSPKSPEFFKLYQRLEADTNFVAHSVFSDDRQQELSSKLSANTQAPLVLAWGLSAQLDPLIHRCLARLPPQRAIKGLLAEGTTNKYRHPLPTLQRDKRIWLDKMVCHCQSP
ncbi:MAG TPA: DUF1643 domain-containing protein, partial [Pirellulaceae bacterium]|nr:DUF1643 domain-containing protein [Pirellulaceae bacterium]